MAVHTISGKDPLEQDGRRWPGRPGRPATAGTVPPSYPDPESWRRFGLLRRQLQHSKGLHAITEAPART